VVLSKLFTGIYFPFCWTDLFAVVWQGVQASDYDLLGVSIRCATPATVPRCPLND
jgi:hypothetical protein